MKIVALFGHTICNTIST